MKSQELESSLTTQSNVFRLFGLVVAVGCVAVGAGAMAIGLIVPSWDIFKVSPKVPAPAKALASTASSSGINSATAPQGVELIVRSAPSSPRPDEPTPSPLAQIPAASLQRAESKASEEPASEKNVPAWPPVAVPPKEPPVNSAIATASQDSDATAATSSIAVASPTSPPEAEPKPSMATPSHNARPIRSVQSLAPTASVHKPRFSGGPKVGQRMWYK